MDGLAGKRQLSRERVAAEEGDEDRRAGIGDKFANDREALLIPVLVTQATQSREVFHIIDLKEAKQRAQRMRTEVLRYENTRLAESERSLQVLFD